MRMRIAAILAAGVLLSASTAGAQQAEPQVSPEPAPPPASDATTLPEVVIDTAAEDKKATPQKKPKAQGTGTAQGTGVPASAPPPNNTARGPETAYGPVEGYAATRTATGIKTDTPLKEIPQSISVVGSEQIRDMGAQTLQDTLRYVPGAVADAYGLDSRTDSVLIRGTDAAEYLDGLRRTFSYYTYNYRIDPFFMERIEVLRGPASVLYGQAPVGGIINSVSKRPETEESGEFTVEYGTFDYKQVKFDMTGPASADGKWSYRLAGLARDADTQVDYVEDDRYAIQPALTYRPDSDTTITLLGLFQKDHSGSTGQFYPHIGTIFPNVNGRHISRDRFVGEPGDYYDTDVASGTLIFEHEFNSVFKVQHTSRYADIHNDYDSTYAVFWAPYVPGSEEEELYRTRWKSITDTQIFTQDTNLQAKFATGAMTHRILGGVDYTHFKAAQGTASADDVNPFNVYNPKYGQGMWTGTDCAGTFYDGVADSLDDLEVCSFADQSVSQTGLYIQDQIRLENWIAVLGVRKDWITNKADGSDTQKDAAVSYRAGLMYELASGLTPYVSYAESFIPVVAPGGPFDPRGGRMYELGFKYQPNGANFAINGAIYDLTESNQLEYFPGYAVQTGGIAVQGLEIELTGQMTENLKLVTGYSYTDAQYDGDDPATAGHQVESVPQHLASLWGVWEFDQPELKGWSVGAGVRYVGGSWDSSNTIKVPDVTLFDAMIAYEEDHWRWSINGRNLEDKEYWQTCLARGDCFVGTARTVTTSLTYKY